MDELMDQFQDYEPDATDESLEEFKSNYSHKKRYIEWKKMEAIDYANILLKPKKI